jgi:hypothetical protein
MWATRSVVHISTGCRAHRDATLQSAVRTHRSKTSCVVKLERYRPSVLGRMSGQHSCKLGSRLRSPRIEVGESARFFLCGLCRTQAFICRCCDRGQVYCSGDCAQEARRENQRRAGRRYQTSSRGRAAHALRARRYRARRKAVTHRGPPQRSQGDPAVERAATESQSLSREAPMRPTFSCDRCGRPCSPFVRQKFLRRRRARRTRRKYSVRHRPP